MNVVKLIGGGAAAVALAWTAAATYADGAQADDLRALGRRAMLAALDAAAEANGVRIDQRGGGNAAGVAQTGQGNLATLNQYGRDNNGGIGQTGNDNTACLVQAGRGLDGSIVQNGDGHGTGVLQTRRGTYEFPAAICYLDSNERIYGYARQQIRRGH